MIINNWRLWVGIGVSVIFLVFLLWSIDPDKLIQALREANYWYVIPAVIIYFIVVYFRAYRWRYILSPLRSFPVSRLYPVVVMGYAANNVLPARIGELVRAYYLSQRERFSSSTALATIGVERVYDGLTLLAFGVVSLLTLLLLGEFDSAESACRSTVQVTCQTAALAVSAAAAVVFCTGLAVITLLAVNHRAARFIYLALGLLPSRLRRRAWRLARSFILGLSILNSPKHHRALALRSLPVWLGEGAVYLTIAYSFGLAGYFDSLGGFLFAIMLVTTTSNLANAFPAAIGAIGPFEFIAELTLVSLGVDKEVALSYALVAHLLALWLPVNLAGLALMWKQNLSLKQLTAAPAADPGPLPGSEGEYPPASWERSGAGGEGGGRA